jgi:hypothetical protein
VSFSTATGVYTQNHLVMSEIAIFVRRDKPAWSKG